MDDTEILQLDQLERTHWWYIARKRVLGRWLKRHRKLQRILDAGSASGGNTLFMVSLGFNVVSVEYSKVGCELQTSKGIKVIQGDLTSLEFDSGIFDGIVCMDVLEHIVDDGKAVAELFRVLKPGGEVLISVPQDPKLWSSHDVAVNHFRRYERTKLIDLCANLGFQIVDSYNSVIILKPILKVYRRLKLGSDLKPVNPIMNIALNSLSFIEEKTYLRRIGGVTLWLELKKDS